MITIFKLENGEGYGYKVDCVYQEYDPDQPGFVPMTEERATQLANEVLIRLKEQEN